MRSGILRIGWFSKGRLTVGEGQRCFDSTDVDETVVELVEMSEIAVKRSELVETKNSAIQKLSGTVVQGDGRKFLEHFIRHFSLIFTRPQVSSVRTIQNWGL